MLLMSQELSIALINSKQYKEKKKSLKIAKPHIYTLQVNTDTEEIIGWSSLPQNYTNFTFQKVEKAKG